MSPSVPTSGQRLVLLEDEGGPGVHRAMTAIERRGAQVLHRYGNRVLVCTARAAAADALDRARGVRGVHAEPTERLPRGASPTEELGISAWNLRRSTEFARAKSERPRDGEAWDVPGVDPLPPDGPGMTHVAEPTVGPEQRAIFFGGDMSPYLLGSVAVALVIVEGPTPELRFSDAERAKVVAEVQEGLGWLATREPRASVSFAYDIRIVTLDRPPNPALRGYELLESHWRDPALAQLGCSANFTGTAEHAQRVRSQLATRWAFVAYFTKYPVNHFAYALKPKVVMHYQNDGWGPDNIDRVFAHETGHIFGAPDEYASANCSCTAKFGWWREPNGNCHACAVAPVDCLMAANTWAMCGHTPIHLGWRDSNGDGLLDETSGSQLFDLRKLCSAVPLVCQLIGLSPQQPGTPSMASAPGVGPAGVTAMETSVPILLLERTLEPAELEAVQQAARREELQYLLQVERRLRAALRELRAYRATLEEDGEA